MQKTSKYITLIIYFFVYYSGLIHFFRKVNKNNIVLFYHYVDNGHVTTKFLQSTCINIDQTLAKSLTVHINYLKKYFHLYSLEKLVTKDGYRLAAITFDDGFRSVFKYFNNRNDNVPYTLFLNTYYYDKNIGLPLHNIGFSKDQNDKLEKFFGSVRESHENNLRIWNSLDASIKDEIRRLYITNEDLHSIKELKNITVGGHAHSHRRLLNLSKIDQKEEIELNKNILEDIFKRNIDFFAYPFGHPEKDYNEKTMSIVKNCGYAYAFSAESKFSYNEHDYSLPRLWGGNKPIWHVACEIERVLPQLKKILSKMGYF